MATLSTPAAILVGSVIIGSFLGAGLYLGLRDRSSVPPGGAPEAASSTTFAASSTVPAHAAADIRAATSEVHDQVARALEEARSTLVKQCWAPALTSPGPESESFRIHLVFDASGEQLGRSFLQTPGGHGGIVQCLSSTLPPFHVSPPGAKVTLEVPFRVP